MSSKSDGAKKKRVGTQEIQQIRQRKIYVEIEDRIVEGIFPAERVPDGDNDVPRGRLEFSLTVDVDMPGEILLSWPELSKPDKSESDLQNWYASGLKRLGEKR